MNTKDTPAGMYFLLFLQLVFVVYNAVRFFAATSSENLFPAIEYGVATVCSVVAFIGLVVIDNIRTSARE